MRLLPPSAPEVALQVPIERKPVWLSLDPDRDGGVVGGAEEGLGLWAVVEGSDEVSVGLKALQFHKEVSLPLKYVNQGIVGSYKEEALLEVPVDAAHLAGGLRDR